MTATYRGGSHTLVTSPLVMEKVLGRVGGCITRGPILFTPDDEFILLAKGPQVLILDGKKATPLGSLEGRPDAPAHRNEPILSMAFHPIVPSQLFTASADGIICLWHWEAGVLMHRLQLGHQITSIGCSSITDELFVATATATRGSDRQAHGHKAHNIKTRGKERGHKDDGEDDDRPRRGERGATTKHSATILGLKVNEIKRRDAWRVVVKSTGLGTAPMTISADGRRMAVGRKDGFELWDLEMDPRGKNVRTVHLGYTPIRLALHPCEPILYWTDGTGSIFGMGKAEGDAISKMHWHAHAALSLTVTRDGAYLLSGGQEGVIVAWPLGGTNGGERHFIPHLGTNVLRLASNHRGSMYAALLRSNTLLLISAASLQIVARHEGLQASSMRLTRSSLSPTVCFMREPPPPPPPSPSPSPSPQSITAHTMMDTRLLLNGGLPGTLQVFDPLRGHGIGQIDVCEQNLVGRGNTRAGLTPATVHAVAISEDGQWMATYDRRTGTAQGHTRYDQLRFWRRLPQEKLGNNHSGPSFKAQNSYDAPHGGAPIRQLAFHPTHNQCTTVGDDRRACIWSVQGVQVTEGQGGIIKEVPVWTRSQSLEYRGESVQAVAYSADGSVLALGFGRVARLYDAFSLRFLGALVTNSGHRGPITELLFLRGGKDYLVATTEDGSVHVWNLGTMSLVWALLVPAHGLRLHPEGGSFFVIVQNPPLTKMSSTAPASLILHLDPRSATPRACYKHSTGLLALEIIMDGQVLCLLDQTGYISLISLRDASSPLTPTPPPHLCLMDETTDNAYQVRRRKYAGQRASTLMNPEERPEVIQGMASNSSGGERDASITSVRPILSAVPIEEVLLSTVASHLLPSTREAFHHHIKYKFPLK